MGIGRQFRYVSLAVSLTAAAMLGPGALAAAPILIGQTAGYSGAVAGSVKETADGAKLYIDAVNSRGGVNGRPIELISLDDKFDPKLAGENAAKLIDQGVVALFLTRGTPHNQAILPLLAKSKVPLIAPSTGAILLHEPVNPWVFNVRASYQREVQRAIQHLSQTGVDRIAVVQVDDSFGADAAAGAQKGLAAINKKAVADEKYDRAKPDFSKLVPKVMQADPQAILFLGSGSAVVDGVAAFRAAGSIAQIVTLSNNASAGFIKALGPNARGVIVSQVFPYERSFYSPMVKEITTLGKAKGIAEITPAMLEGFAAAKVLVEGLRRAGNEPTRAGLQKALENLKGFDIGGLEINYSPSNHSGLDFVDMSIIGGNGKFQR